MSMKLMSIISPLQLPGYSSNKGVEVGLQTLLLTDPVAAAVSDARFHNTFIHYSTSNTNTRFHKVVTKSFTALPPPILPSSDTDTHHSITNSNNYGLLNYCNLCSSRLSPKKDVYMYRGDKGFCSTKCRDSQIQIDQLKEFDLDQQSYSSSSSTHLFNSSYYCYTTDRQGTKASLFEIASSNSSKERTRTTNTSSAAVRGYSSSSIPGRRPILAHYNRTQRPLVHIKYSR